MMVPLYKGNAAPQTRPNTAHTGLWFDKFYNQWPASFGELKDVDPDRKRKWLATITASTIGSNQMLQEYADRVRALAKARGGSILELTNCSRIANGMGNPNPIENGLQWHPTLGVPFLPATSLKGLARAWAALEAEISKNEDARSNIDRLFGPEDGTDRAAGSVIFTDALPCAPVRLEADVMTPHYLEYYQDSSGKSPPADWYPPRPIPFLTIAPGQRFLFVILPRRASASSDVAIAKRWLQEALLSFGVGGKTATGYGRFGPAAAKLAPAGRAARRQLYKSGDIVDARRVEDPRGRDRVWFEADDGFGGTIVPGGPLFEVAIGETVKLRVQARHDTGYNFSLPNAHQLDSNKQRQKKRR